MTTLTYGQRRPVHATATPRRFPFVFLWALFGLASLTVTFTTFGRWLVSEDFARTPNGPDSISDGNLVLIRILEVASVIAAAYLVWRFLLKALFRERTITFDGMMLIGSFSLFVYDPVVNYFNGVFVYNTHFFNRGSWARFIPGFESPNQMLLPEPLIFSGTGYIWWVFASALLGSAIVRGLKRRYPSMSNPGMWLSLGAIIAVLDFIVEFSFGVFEIWRYPGAPHYGVLFAGEPYQFPLHEPMFVAFFTVGIVMIRYYRDDRGNPSVLTGVQELKAPNWVRSTISTVAVTGALFVAIMVGYFLPFQVYALKANNYAAQPSYMRAGICGTGTEYACPNSYVPIPKRNSIHIAPDDPRLPESVRDQQISPR